MGQIALTDRLGDEPFETGVDRRSREVDDQPDTRQGTPPLDASGNLRAMPKVNSFPRDRQDEAVGSEDHGPIDLALLVHEKRCRRFGEMLLCQVEVDPGTWALNSFSSQHRN